MPKNPEVGAWFKRYENPMKAGGAAQVRKRRAIEEGVCEDDCRKEEARKEEGTAKR